MSRNIKEEMSIQLRQMGQAGFGPLEQVIRKLIFSDKNQIDWTEVEKEFNAQNPEKKGN